MSENLNTYLTRARRYVRELDTGNSFWTETFLTQLFNASYRRRCAQLIMAYEGFFHLVATRDIETGKESYGFPDGLQRLIKLEIVRSDGTRVPLRRFERHETPNPDNSTTGGGDSYWPTFRPFSHGFVIEPPPIETVTNGLRLEYVGIPAFLSASGDTLHPSFPAIFEELLVLDTVCAALDAEGLHELGPIPSIKTMRAEYEGDFERFVESRVIARNRIEPFIGSYFDY